VYSFAVQITIDIPDDLAAKVIPLGRDAAYVATELFGLQACRDGRISERVRQSLLGLEGLKTPTGVEPAGNIIWITERGAGKAVSIPMPN